MKERYIYYKIVFEAKSLGTPSSNKCWNFKGQNHGHLELIRFNNNVLSHSTKNSNVVTQERMQLLFITYHRIDSKFNDCCTWRQPIQLSSQWHWLVASFYFFLIWTFRMWFECPKFRQDNWRKSNKERRVSLALQHSQWWKAEVKQ